MASGSVSAGIVATAAAAGDEVDVHQARRREPVGGDEHLGVRAPHEDAIAGAVVRVDRGGQRPSDRAGGGTSRGRTAGRTRRPPGSDRRRRSPTAATGPAEARRDRRGEHDGGRDDLQPVVTEEAQPGGHRRRARRAARPTGRGRRVRQAGDGGRRRPGDDQAGDDRHVEHDEAAERRQAAHGGRPRARAGEDEAGAVGHVPLPEPAERGVQAGRGDDHDRRARRARPPGASGRRGTWRTPPARRRAASSGG